MTTRIYLPATLSELRAAQLGSEVPTLSCHAVTDELRAEAASEDYQEEELEYLAQLAAATQSLERIAQDPTAPRLRVVLAADVPDDALTSPQQGPGLEGVLPASVVELKQPVLWSAVVCAHVDEEPSAELVQKVLQGSEEALEELFERDLLWWDATEFAVIPG